MGWGGGNPSHELHIDMCGWMGWGGGNPSHELHIDLCGWMGWGGGNPSHEPPPPPQGKIKGICSTCMAH